MPQEEGEEERGKEKKHNKNNGNKKERKGLVHQCVKLVYPATKGWS